MKKDKSLHFVKICTVQVHCERKAMDFTHTTCRRWKTAIQQQIVSSCILFTFPEQVHLQQLKRETNDFPSPLNPPLHLKKKSKIRMVSH